MENQIIPNEPIAPGSPIGRLFKIIKDTAIIWAPTTGFALLVGTAFKYDNAGPRLEIAGTLIAAGMGFGFGIYNYCLDRNIPKPQ